MGIFSEVMSAGVPINPSTSPFFGAQDWGDGSGTMGNADGSGFFNFDQAGVQSPFGNGSGAINPAALNEWMASTGMGLFQESGPSGDYRYLQDSSGKQVGDKQFFSADESDFMAAAMAAMALTGANVAGAGGFGGGIESLGGGGGEGLGFGGAEFGAVDPAAAGLGGAFPSNASVAGFESLAPGTSLGGDLGIGGAAFGGGDLAAAASSSALGIGDSTRAALYGKEGYGAPMTGLQTSTYDGALEMGLPREMAKAASATVGGELTFSDIISALGSGLSPVAAAGGSGGMGGIPGIFNIGSGIYGLMQSRKMRKAMDPFSKYRAGYGKELAALEADPSRITSRPGWRAGNLAVQRGAAAGGYLGSGNEMLALQDFGGNFYNQEAQRLASLAGAGVAPGSGFAQSADLAGQSLASLGYGVSPFLRRGP